MKVFGQVQLVVAFLVLSVFAGDCDCYATLEGKAERTQQEQPQAEVNGNPNASQSRIRFGMKTGAKTKPTGVQVSDRTNESGSKSLVIEPEKASRNRNKNSNAVPHLATEDSTSSSESFLSLNRNGNKTKVFRNNGYNARGRQYSASATVAQHEIPIMHKNNAASHVISSTNDSTEGSHKRGLRRQSFHQRDEAIAERTSTVSRTQSQRRRASNSPSGEVKSNVQAASRRNRTSKGAATTIASITTTPYATTQQSLFPSSFQISNPFDFIPQFFGNLSRAVSPGSSHRKPPKKYYPSTSTTTSTPISSKLGENKITQKSPVKVMPLRTTQQKKDTPTPEGSDGPFRIALPTMSFFNPPTTSAVEKEKGKRATVQTLRERFNCPRESEVRFQLFPKICKTDKDCSIWNRDELCCEIFGASSCVSGIPKPLEETVHMPILGVIPRKCPTRPLAELWWDVQECETDNDCWPRVCCPDGRRRYCRTSQPELEVVPVPVKRSFNYLTEYLECTAPPPAIFDLHPKACTSTFDCFPNVCCQEAGLRHCRPPKKSVLTLMANFLNVDFVKRLTQNIVIK